MKDRKNTTGNTLLLLSGIVAILLMVFNFVKIKSINETTERIRSEEAMLSERKAYLDELKKLTHIRPELEKAHVILSEQIPKSPEEDRLIEYIDQLAREKGTDFVHIQFEKRTTNGNMNEMPIQLMFKGKYASLVDFIKRVSNGDRLIRIDGIQIDGEGSDGTVNASVTAKAFFK